MLSATFAQGAPPSAGALSFNVPEAEGAGRIDAPELELPLRTVAPDYFATLGVSLVAGRSFTADETERVVIVNDCLARRLWDGASPIGRRCRFGPNAPWHTVVGVAADVKEQGLEDSVGDGMEAYFPYERGTAERYFTVIVRTSADHASTVQQVKQHLWRSTRMCR